MKVTWNWLNEFVDLNGLSIEDLEQKLAMQGVHIEEIEYCKERVSNVVVGYVKSVEKHPDADRLKICMVDVGESEPLQIVTAAPNIRADVFVPVALVGAVLYDGTKIKKGKLRGAVSLGMFCSLEELGLEEDSDGIYIIDKDAYPETGDEIYHYVGLDDIVIDFEITANRSDLLSVAGIAREIAVATGREFKYPQFELKMSDKKSEDEISVELNDGDLCYRYTARFLGDVKIAPSPILIRSRLELTGMRSINNVVDITNYVMLELGIPMHAFDADEINGRKIIIRRAKNGEEFKTLADHKLVLSEDDLLISDTNKGIALAGVIGGENSEIKENTSGIILEVASFSPVSIRKTAKRYGISTESSYRFERGMDFEIIDYVSDRASYLFSKYAGAVIYGNPVDKKSDKYPQKRVITLRYTRLNSLFGGVIPKEKVETILKALDFVIKNKTNDTISVEVPSFRYWDIEREVDLIEEVIRIFGYDNTNAVMPILRLKQGKHFEIDTKEKIKEILRAYGVYEAYLFPFVHENIVSLLNIDETSLYKVKNPLTKDLEYLTPDTLLPFLKVVELNIKRGNKIVKLYETGKEFDKKSGEHEVITVVLSGKTEKALYGKERTFDYYDIKGIVDQLLEYVNNEKVVFEPSSRTVWQEGYKVLIAGELLFEYGALNKKLTKAYDLKNSVWGLKIYTEIAKKYLSFERKFVSFSQFPPVYFDLALVVDKDVEADALLSFIRKNSGKMLESVRIFDIYEGDKLPNGKKSIAFSLLFRANDRTLTEKEVNKAVDKLIKAVNTRFGATLR